MSRRVAPHAVAAALPLLLAGCVFYVGAEAQSPHGLQDLRYGDGRADLLRPGVLREDVLLALGVPDRVLDGGGIVVYAAPVESGQLFVVLSGNAGGVLPLGRSVALAVAFDAQGRYARHAMAFAGLGEPEAAAQRALLALRRDGAK